MLFFIYFKVIYMLILPAASVICVYSLLYRFFLLLFKSLFLSYIHALCEVPVCVFNPFVDLNNYTIVK